jgi:hypothetical protein
MATYNVEMRQRISGSFADILYAKTTWAMIESKPSTFTPTSHVHGNITNAGAIGSTSDQVIITTTAGVLTTQSRSGIDSRSTFPPIIGSGASDAVAGNDSRLTNERTPSIHNFIDTTRHPVSGLTTGHFLKATGATTYGFAAHELDAAAVSALPIGGGTMTGILYPQQNTSYTTGQARRIILSTGDPTGGGNGDVWIKYTA